ncbi:unnamed protein product [Blepharisma stoltei]|uniref:Ribonucleotide reductase alpha-helical domain-containing protein n=1 Tax=Blepharisma stoltei TaxID=1481888 RepID=A0AAU9K8S0_9CILI|nr:unnamed protein product [Blepharisma stoltei]
MTFKLSEEFIRPYREIKPKFGFNGLGEIIFRRSYSRMKDDRSYESWSEALERVVNGTINLMLKKSQSPVENLTETAEKMYDKMFNFKFLPPGRGLWNMGSKCTEVDNFYTNLNNCAFVSTKDIDNGNPSKPFAFLMEASFLGIGVGFDTKGANKISICSPNGIQDYSVEDTRDGWVSSVALLLNSYFKADQPEITFSYENIHDAGTPVKDFGISRGSDPLQNLHSSIRNLLTPQIGQKITSRLIVDIMNLIGKCVVADNVRMPAEIAFGEPNDLEFQDLKDYEKNPERLEFGWNSNNSILAELGMDYQTIAEKIIKNGEPGIAWLENMQKYGRMQDAPNNKDKEALGGPPCLEQTLESYELCCLVEIFINNHSSLEEFLDTLKYAFIYAKTVTLGLTHWPDVNEVMTRNRRIGTSLTGIAQFLGRESLGALKLWCCKGYRYLKRLDRQLSRLFGVSDSIKITTVKPSGTISLLAGASSGLHFPFAHTYIRRIRMQLSDTNLLNKLQAQGYHIEPDFMNENAMVVSIPIKENENVKVLKEVSMWEQLSLAAFMQYYWADNQVSCTVTFDPETEGKLIPDALNYFQYKLKGICFLPSRQSLPYPQMPYEEISAEKYLEMQKSIKSDVEYQQLSEEVERARVPVAFCDGCTAVV